MLGRAIALVCVLGGAPAGAPCAGDDVPFRALEDTLIVRADEAWEAAGEESMYLRGNLRIAGRNWHIDAEQARIGGPLEDPDIIVVEGAPARIVVSSGDDDIPVEGESRHLEFEPRSESLRLSGGARVVRGGDAISSESIDYLVKRHAFAAGRGGRVKTVTTPDRL